MYQRNTPINVLLVLLLLSVFGSEAYGQYTIFTSKDNSYGLWDAEDTWIQVGKPGFSGGSNNGSTINGYVKREGNLRMDNGSNLVVNDTLWIRDNLTVMTNLVVRSGGVLIVGGNMEVTNGAYGSIDGVVVVLGNLTGPSYIANNFSSSTGSSFVYGESDFAGTSNESQFANYDNGSGVGDLYSFVEGGGLLPITLSSFEGYATAEGIELNWTTETEENFDFFTVERAGADLQFEAIARIDGQGGIAQVAHYDFVDEDFLVGIYYYRLKATDFDGSEEYHKTISVMVEKKALQTAIFPNPVTNQKIYVQSDESAGQLQVVNYQGAVVFQAGITAGQNAYTLPDHLTAGYYTAVINHGSGQREQHRLLIR